MTTERLVVTPRVFDADSETLCAPAGSTLAVAADDEDDTGVSVVPVDFDT